MSSAQLSLAAPQPLAPFVTGAGRYVADVTVAGQAWLSVVRSTVANGRLTGIDAEAARELPGVLAVLSAGDLGEIPRIPIRRGARAGMDRCLQPVIARDRVRYVGEPVAVVVADSPYVAEDAMELVDAAIEPLSVVDAVETAETSSVPLHDGVEGNVLCRTTYEDGDGPGDAVGVTVSAEFRTGRITGVPIETRGLLARWDEARARLEVWGATKFLVFTRALLATFFDVPVDAVVCHRVDVGGMFGPRGEFYPEDFLVPWAARVTGRPVKWIEDRREHFLTANQAREQVHRVTIEVARDGTFLSLRDHARVDMGAYARPIGARVPELVVETLPGPYHWRRLDLRVEGLLTNKTPVGTVRGPSALEANFVRERVIDMAAARLGLDPVELRRRNLVTRDDMPFERSFGGELEPVVLDTGDFAWMLEDFLQRTDYAGRAARAAARRDEGAAVGLGVGLFVEPSGIGKAECVELRHDQGRFTVVTSASDVGQGLDHVLRRVAAEALGVDAEQIRVESGSTARHSGSSGTFGSRTTIFVGSALSDACRRLVDEVRHACAQRWGVCVDAVGYAGGQVLAGEHKLAWTELPAVTVSGVFESSGPEYGFGCHLAEVQVDPATGTTALVRLDAAYDCGRVLDRAAVEGQLVGAAVHGVGASMFEELRYQEGQPSCTSFMDYLLPTCAEVPDVVAHPYEVEPSVRNPLGVKGAGEAGVAAVGSATANAVADALGNRADGLTELPLTPERVRAAAAAARRDERTRHASS